MPKIVGYTLVHRWHPALPKVVRQSKYFDDYVFLYNEHSWFDKTYKDDGTLEFLKSNGVRLIECDKHLPEADCRNMCLQELGEYRYAVTIDDDEVWDFQLLEGLIEFLMNSDAPFITLDHKNMLTYWKDESHVVKIRGNHCPIIATRLGIRFTNARCCRETGHTMFASKAGFMHHFSWVGPKTRVEQKVKSYSHAKEIANDWVDRVWLKGNRSDEQPVVFDEIVKVR